LDDGAVRVVSLGAWCDFVTEDEYRQQLVRNGWPAGEVENLVEDFREGVSFVVHEFAELADAWRLTLHEERGFSSSQWHYRTLEDLERSVRTTVLPPPLFLIARQTIRRSVRSRAEPRSSWLGSGVK
jgi:hypothetical protein